MAWFEASSEICRLTRFEARAHLARATLEGICFQTKEVVRLTSQDPALAMTSLRVDGGLTKSDLFVQLQADILGVPISA